MQLAYSCEFNSSNGQLKGVEWACSWLNPLLHSVPLPNMGHLL